MREDVYRLGAYMRKLLIFAEVPDYIRAAGGAILIMICYFQVDFDRFVQQRSQSVINESN